MLYTVPGKTLYLNRPNHALGIQMHCLLYVDCQLYSSDMGKLQVVKYAVGVCCLVPFSVQFHLIFQEAFCYSYNLRPLLNCQYLQAYQRGSTTITTEYKVLHDVQRSPKPKSIYVALSFIAE